MNKISFFSILIVFLASLSFGEDVDLFSVGKKAYDKGNYRQAVSYFSKLSEIHYSQNRTSDVKIGQSQFYIGEIKEYIEGKTSDARMWYILSAKNNYRPAQKRLAEMYEEGLGGERDLYKAKFWYEKAGENNASRGVQVSIDSEKMDKLAENIATIVHSVLPNIKYSSPPSDTTSNLDYEEIHAHNKICKSIEESCIAQCEGLPYNAGGVVLGRFPRSACKNKCWDAYRKCKK